ncbi:SecDF P1 head subdomain-containing protein [Bradyrhizobium sp. HKCCYLS2058]|uniref:SecDF P1 head subdomain-containing protein n=1 Tax=unclassified Bradyrhizobium TaxID=2631580 RepID=UPI003EBE91CF
MAEQIVVPLVGAVADHDQRTGRPILRLSFAEASNEKMRNFGNNHAGEKVEFCLHGRVLFMPVLREPMSAGTAQISDPSWTDQVVLELAKQLSDMPAGEIEIRSLAEPK